MLRLNVPMDKITAEFEVFENRLMRAWMNRDASEVKTLVSRQCLMLFGTTPPTMLDRPSFIAGLDRGLACVGFRFHDAAARRHGKCVWYSGQIEVELRVGAIEWSGHFLLTDLWRRGVIRRRWQLAERSLTPTVGDRRLPDAIRALQLWR